MKANNMKHPGNRGWFRYGIRFYVLSLFQIPVVGLTLLSGPASAQSPADACAFLQPSSYVSNYVRTTVGSNYNLRPRPGTDCAPIGTITASSQVKVHSESGSWRFVEYLSGNGWGWLYKDALTASANTHPAQPQKGTSTQAPAEKPAPSPTSGCDFFQPTSYVANYVRTTISSSNYNLRPQPNDTCAPIGTISASSQVKVHAETGNWRFVENLSGSGWGWLFKTAIRVLSDAPETPAPSTGCAFLQPTSYVSNYVRRTSTDSNYNLRPRSNDSCTPIGSVAANSQVKVHSESGNWRFIENLSGSGWGWIHKRAIEGSSTPEAPAEPTTPSTPRPPNEQTPPSSNGPTMPGTPRPPSEQTPPGNNRPTTPSSPRPPSEQTPPSDPGSRDIDCRPDLSCTIEYIRGLSLQDRTDWFNDWIVERYGVSEGFAPDGNDTNWFANIESVLEIAPGRFDNNLAFNLIDSFILHAVQDGLRRHLGRLRLVDPDYGENKGGDSWHRFFDSLEGGGYNDQRKNWGLAEQLATNHGREAAEKKGWRLDSKTYQLLIRIGDKYRQLVANPADARSKANEIAELICVDIFDPFNICSNLITNELTKKFDPRTPGLVFGLAASSIWGDFVPGPANLLPLSELPRILGDDIVGIGQAIIGFNGRHDWPCTQFGRRGCGDLGNGY